jgi:predicted O-methyltransferase YrrM
VSTHFDDTSVRTPSQYARILSRSRELEFSMNSDILTGSLLRMLARSKPGGSFLELGTGCGLGTCWLLDGMDTASRLVSVDVEPVTQAIAREALAADARLTLVLRDGGEFLETCEERFDLIYADAWPGKYSHLERALDRLAPGGFYVIDDMLPQPNWPPDHPVKVAALLDKLAGMPDLEMSTLAWSTGVVVCTKH